MIVICNLNWIKIRKEDLKKSKITQAHAYI